MSLWTSQWNTERSRLAPVSEYRSLSVGIGCLLMSGYWRVRQELPGCSQAAVLPGETDRCLLSARRHFSRRWRCYRNVSGRAVFLQVPDIGLVILRTKEGAKGKRKVSEWLADWFWVEAALFPCNWQTVVNTLNATVSMTAVWFWVSEYLGSPVSLLLCCCHVFFRPFE